jgi:hypothetical protein
MLRVRPRGCNVLWLTISIVRPGTAHVDQVACLPPESVKATWEPEVRKHLRSMSLALGRYNGEPNLGTALMVLELSPSPTSRNCLAEGTVKKG